MSASADADSDDLVEVEDDAAENDIAEHELEPITYFGTDFDVHGLVRRLNNNEIVVPNFDPTPSSESDLSGFQRKFVWTPAQMHRFVESLLLGFPIPGIFLVQQANKTMLVLDGQQRLRTLQKFYDDEFALTQVSDEYVDLHYSLLEDEQRRTLDNTFIHATIVRYNPDKGGDQSVYQLFERLNTGGTNLYPHEIRVALYNGKLVELIRVLNSDKHWRALYGNVNPRLKDQELILRFIALYYASEDYERPLKTFLNDFLRERKQLKGLRKREITSVFTKTCAALNESIGSKAFRLKRAVNAALVDSVMVGMARRIAKKPASSPDAKKVKRSFQKLITQDEFLTAIGRATADEERVRTRLSLATKAFERT